MGRELQGQASRECIVSVFALKTHHLLKEVQTILLKRGALGDDRDHVERGHVEGNQSSPAVPAIPVEALDNM